VVKKVSDLVNGLQVIGEPNKVDANLNAKKLFGISLRYLLCSKNVILNERLTAPALEWLLAEIKSKFEQSIVCPGEMVGAIAA
jgi:DNA-directed RNA polymerase II subunit RPB1